MQTDPIGIMGGVNLYGYVGGDPVNLVDPWGLLPFCVSRTGTEVGPDGQLIVIGTERDCGTFEWLMRVPINLGQFVASVTGSPSAPQSPVTTICQRRDWHNLMRDQKVQALREAGFLVAVEVYIRTISYDDARGYAIADYIATIPNSGVFIIGEIKTGDASLVPR